MVVWSFVAEVFASLTTSTGWIADTSPLAHMAPAPAAPPDWTVAAWLVGAGIVAALVGLAAFRRRDLVEA